MKKRIAVIVLSSLILTALCGCETPEEKELRKAQEASAAAHAAYQDAKESYDKLIRDIKKYDDLHSRLK